MVETTVYVSPKVTPDDYAELNKVYTQYFPKDYPARAGLIVGFMYPDMLVEIKAVAYCWSVLGLFVEALVLRDLLLLKGYVQGLSNFITEKR